MQYLAVFNIEVYFISNAQPLRKLSENCLRFVNYMYMYFKKENKFFLAKLLIKKVISSLSLIYEKKDNLIFHES